MHTCRKKIIKGIYKCCLNVCRLKKHRLNILVIQFHFFKIKECTDSVIVKQLCSPYPLTTTRKYIFSTIKAFHLNYKIKEKKKKKPRYSFCSIIKHFDRTSFTPLKNKSNKRSVIRHLENK